MKIYVLLIAVFSVILPILSEIRYNRYRGPAPPRPPHPPPYVKSKWPLPPRGPSRNYVRPIPVQMASYKSPVIVPRPPRVPAPVIFPSAIWKTPANVYRPPIEKPFLSSPHVNKPYDFINNEPALSVSAQNQFSTNTIKQVGEKGPIHTIPAPNLSPADKPAIIREEIPHKSAYNFKEQEISLNSIHHLSNQLPQALPLVQPHFQQAPLPQTLLHQQPSIALHQYQVTEYSNDQQLPSERPAQFNGQQTYYAPDPDPKLNSISQFNADFSTLGNSLNLNNLFPQGTELGVPQPSILAAQQNIVAPPGVLSHQELLQILNSIPEQHLVDSYGTPLVQQSQIQPHYTSVQAAPQAQFLQQPQIPQQLFQPEFLNQIQDVPDSVKNNFKPQFHTFNYEEQSRHKTVPNDFAQSRVTGDYTLEPETAENNPTILIQTPNDALAQAQYVQQYFSNNDENNVLNNNIVETEVHNKDATRILSQLASSGEVTPNMFYSSLPNREAAEALATLQAAGNVNSNLMQTLQQTEPNTQHSQMRIYVPDDEETEELETSGENDENKNEAKQAQTIKIYETTYLKTPNNHKSKESAEYEEYLAQQDDANAKNLNKKEDIYNQQNQVTFGSRIKAKNDT